ncbi:MAG: diguanylate cyclase, partial [Lachnospiraceae bacterium]|nr:diguanylate cyclase [Lachnospiraceae bacterium]
MKRTDRIGFKLGLAFALFSVIILIIVGLMTYINQMAIYKAQCEKDVKSVGRYIRSLIVADGVDFIQYMDYYLEHYTEADIPVDVDEYESYENRFRELFDKRYPGKTFGVDISFDELDEDVKQAYFIYSHVYWLLTFEWARADFNLTYTYFLLPDEETHTVMYVVDGERSSRAGHLEFIEENPQYKEYHHEQGDEAEYLYLGDTYLNNDPVHNILWDTWISGEEQDGFVVWNNQWGDTYSYYVPVWINGEKLGLVVTEIDIADVNNEILKNTIRQLSVMTVILLLGLLLLLIFINGKYVDKLVRLESYVTRYTSEKDSGVVEEIRANIRGRDEVTSLANEVVSMIKEIENHIKFLLITNQELAETKGDVAKMTDLAQKDALTGIRNRTAYDKETEKLQKSLEEGDKEFGIVMIDLNYLKRTNDTYGHEKGNESIKKLCFIVCHVFEHSPVFRIGGDEFV